MLFSPGHLIWLALSACLIVGGIIACLRIRPSMTRILTVCFGLALLSETVKVLSVIQIVPIVSPVVEGGQLVYQPAGSFTPYMEADHMPFELCSFQIPLIGIARFAKSERLRQRVLALIYPTAMIGAFLGLVLAYMVRDYTSTLAMFTDPHAYQYFLYHSMLITLGAYIAISPESGVGFSSWKDALIMLIPFDVASFYLNSLLATPVYVNNELAGISHATNFFSSYINPLGIPITEKWQWMVYLVIRIVLTLTLITLFFLPLKRKKVAS